jgi:Na+:H+ antiporter, NhaA family
MPIQIRPLQWARSASEEFLRLEALGGLLLVTAAAFAMIWANSSGAPSYEALLSLPVSVQAGALVLAKPLLLWINDGLMAIFFLLVGLEIKREALEGELSSLAKAALPMIAAVGGIIVPALVYAAINASNPPALRGWAIPTATDIAFALGVLALLGDRVSSSLKLFLLALAIIDDLGAIMIIAAFYTSDLAFGSLVLAGAALIALAILNRAGVTHLAPYTLLGCFLWVCVLKSGVHATLAGVALAFAIPLRVSGEGEPPLHRLEHALHPWVTYAILPLFAFANAGVSLGGMSAQDLLEPVPLGIMLGLLVGKPIGVMVTSIAAVQLGAAALPDRTRWGHLCGVASLTGIGFTMSLFIGTLTFDTPEHLTRLRIGVLVGSLLSALAGYVVLALAYGGRSPAGESQERAD